MMSLDDALVTLMAAASQLRLHETQRVATFDALGRVLAADLVSPLDVPPADNTSMDGYALRVQDVQAEGAVLAVSQRIPAGGVPKPLEPGTAARIFTGGFIPEGADAVVMQEQCEAVEGGVRIMAVPKTRQWIRPRGEDVHRGDVVLARGTLMTPQAMGQAAGVGAGELDVVRRVRVALLSTGDELVMPGTVAPQDMPIGAIYNSNRFTLMGLLRACGCDVNDLGIVPDQLDATEQALSEAARSNDLIISSGGVSVGEEDHIRPALEALGHVALWQLAIKPGKPLAFGGVRRSSDASATEALFIGLPGNPVSSFVTFLLAAMPVIRTLQGAAAGAPKPLPMVADFDWLKPDTKRREFLRVRRSSAGGLELFPNQSSGVLTSAIWGEGLADIEIGRVVRRGDVVPFIPWSTWGIA
jgi:molybdopterin molybdotransferase